ncbi:unnamed protein product [Merluccius merluccius]
MNWVGGSRSRYMMRCDTKKQREFFEKRKIKQRLQNLGLSEPTSGNMDLVTLFIVNQIAAKKEIKDPPKVTVLREDKGLAKNMKNRPLELPMSPGSPSQLSLSESEPYSSVQSVKKRKHCFPDGFKCQQLSPVLESTFSDHSSSEPVQHHLPHPLSPFSSSSACSGQVFPGQPDLQQRGLSQRHLCTPTVPPWTTSDLQQVQFRPFSQPGSMRDTTPWPSGSNRYLTDTLTAAKALFRSPLSQQEDRQPLFGFTLNQSETVEEFEEERFSRFGMEDFSGETLNKSSQWTPQVPCSSRPPAEGGQVQIVSPRHEGHRPQSSQVDPFKLPETRDAETQTCDVTKRQTSDASTQSEACIPLTWHCAAPVSDAILHQGTRRQIISRDRDAEAPSALLLEGFQKGEENRPLRKPSREEGRGQYISDNAIKYRTLNTEGTVDREEMAHPHLAAPGVDDSQAKRRKLSEGGGERGTPDCVVPAPAVKEPAVVQLLKEVTVGGVNRLSEEVETLQEIADILLMLRQRKREG